MVVVKYVNIITSTCNDILNGAAAILSNGRELDALCAPII